MNPTDAELVQHLRGASAPADARRIDDWLAASDDNRRRLDALRTIWNASATRHDTDVDALWSRVAERTTLSDTRRDTRPVPVPRLAIARPAPSRPPIIPIIAAAAVIVAASAAFVYVERERMPTMQAVTTTVPAREYATGRGERSTIRLSDGTTVTLAPLTRVHVLPGFGHASRELSIDGEAIVDVVHDATRPFRVYIGNAVAEDIGTRFAVRSLADDGAVSVAVAEGSVSLGLRSDTVKSQRTILEAGGVGSVDREGHVSRSTTSAMGEYFGWAEGHLSFDDVPLAEVQRTLSRWYNVELRVDDSTLRARRITARFEGQSARSIVSALAITLGADSVSWNGTTATLRSAR